MHPVPIPIGPLGGAKQAGSLHLILVFSSIYLDTDIDKHIDTTSR